MERVEEDKFWCHQCQKEVIPKEDYSCNACGSYFIEKIEASYPPETLPPTQYPSQRAQTRLNSRPAADARPTAEARHAAQSPTPNSSTDSEETTQESEADTTLSNDIAASISTIISSVVRTLDAPTAARWNIDLSAPVNVVLHTSFAPLSSLGNLRELAASGLSNANASQNLSFENLLHQLFLQSQPEGNPPASKKFIQSLKDNPVIINSGDNDSKDRENCVVCKDEWEEGKEVCEMPCKHKFCYECIMPWLEKRNTCPVCRFEVETDSAEYEKKRLARQRDAVE